MALKYWTTWNLAWAVGEQLKLYPYTNSLHVSLITTSIMGAYTVYNRKKQIKIKIGKKIFNLNNKQIIIGDILVHHLPLILAIKNKKRTNIKGCGRNGIIPVLIWYLYINYFYNTYKIYNRNINKLLLSAISIYLAEGLYFHKNLK